LRRTPPIATPKRSAGEGDAAVGVPAGVPAGGDAPPAPPPPRRLAPAIDRARTVIGWIREHERTLSAFGMIAGFVTDNLMFRRIDLPNTQIIFGVYLGVAAASIAGLHFLERQAREGRNYARWRALFPMATQFALGGLWSGFLVFYSRSAVLTQSWPYLAVLACIFLGNELLKAYHARLVFTAVLLFFGIFSDAIVTLPVYTHAIGALTFIASGLVAIGILVLFLYALAAINRSQLVAARGRIALGVFCVYVLMNVFYFTNTLPPLPLALARAGIYHTVKRTGDVYTAVDEPAPWYGVFNPDPVIHVARGQSISAYSAVFAPIKISTRIVHRWRHYDTKAAHWRTLSTISYAINGGRDGGYRGYTIKHNPAPGDWRVDIATGEGRLIGRLAFRVETGDAPATKTETLK
jgi:hypothetical protein